MPKVEGFSIGDPRYYDHQFASFAERESFLMSGFEDALTSLRDSQFYTPLHWPGLHVPAGRGTIKISTEQVRATADLDEEGIYATEIDLSDGSFFNSLNYSNCFTWRENQGIINFNLQLNVPIHTDYATQAVRETILKSRRRKWEETRTTYFFGLSGYGYKTVSLPTSIRDPRTKDFYDRGINLQKVITPIERKETELVEYLLQQFEVALGAIQAKSESV